MLFLTVDDNIPQVVVSKDTWNEVTGGIRSLDSSVSSNSGDATVLHDAAGLLQDIINNYIKLLLSCHSN